MLDDALRLWRGEPFAALDTPWLNDVRDALAAERHAAELDRNDLALRVGQHAAVLTDIVAAVEQEPLDERLAAQLMLAFYRNGRQADALATFRRIRDRLIEELGADPGAPLLRLHRQILEGDPELLAVAAERPGAKRAAAPVPRQLPAPPRGFVGREAELDELDGVLSDAGQPSPCSSQRSPGQVGSARRPWRWSGPTGSPTGFPMVSSTSTCAASTRPGRSWSRARRSAPSSRRSASIRSRCPARSTLRSACIAACWPIAASSSSWTTLVDVDQVRPLLPGAPGCLAVVTSRNVLGGLVVAEGAVPLGLDLLSRDEAWALLADVGCGTPRLKAEPDAVEQIITYCGRLPLALAVVAALAVTRRGASLGALADELGDVRERLNALAARRPGNRTSVRCSRGPTGR